MGFPGGATGKETHLLILELQELRVRFLGREDLLEEVMATHSSIFAWRTPWTDETGGLQSMGSQRVGRDWSALATAAAAEGKDGEHFSKYDLATEQSFGNRLI